MIPRLPINPDGIVVGGSANSLANLCKGWRRIKEEDSSPIVLAGMRPSEISHLGHGHTLSANIQPISLNSTPSSIGYAIEFGVKVLWNVQEIPAMQNCNVLNGHSGYFAYAAITALVAKRMNVPCVHTLYCPVNAKADGQSYPFSHRIARWISGTGTFVAISANVARSLQDADISPERIFVVPPAIDVERFDPNISGAALRQRLGLTSSQPVLLFVGNTKVSKNMDVLLKAMPAVLSSFPDTKLIITTELDHRHSSQRDLILNQLIQDLRLRDHLIFMGIVPNMPEVMATADLLIAPFLDSDGPSDYFLPVLEAMAIGTPVLSADVAGMPEVIVNGENGFLIDPRNVEGLSVAICQFLENREQSTHIAQKARETILAVFEPGHVAKMMEHVYIEVLEKHKNP